MLVDKDELMALAQKKEGFLLEFDEKMRAADQVPDPRPVDNSQPTPLPEAPRPHQPVGERLGALTKDVRERLGPKTDDTPMMDTRECHICKKMGHIARNCPNPTVAATSNGGKPTGNRPDSLAAHKTTSHTCESCNKPGRTEARCWSAHPELVPEALLKKR